MQSPRAFGAVIPVTGGALEQKKVAAEAETEGMAAQIIRARSLLYRIREISLTFQKSACGKYLSSLTAR